MAKHYLNPAAFAGTPGAIPVYRNENASVLSLNPEDIMPGRFTMWLDVMGDQGGCFVLVPVDPSEINGLPALLL